MNEAEEASIHQKQECIVLSTDWAIYYISTSSISMHFNENPEFDREDRGSSHEMIIENRRLVSDDCFIEELGKHLLLLDQSFFVPALRE